MRVVAAAIDSVGGAMNSIGGAMGFIGGAMNSIGGAMGFMGGAISTIADLSKLHKKTPVHIDFVREFFLSENDQFYFTSFKLRTIS